MIRFPRFVTGLLNSTNLGGIGKMKLIKTDLAHPSLQFKKVGKVWFVSVGSRYRAVATPIEGGFLWVWISKQRETFYH